MMRKIFVIVILATVMVAITACGQNQNQETEEERAMREALEIIQEAFEGTGMNPAPITPGATPELPEPEPEEEPEDIPDVDLGLLIRVTERTFDPHRPARYPAMRITTDGVLQRGLPPSPNSIHAAWEETIDTNVRHFVRNPRMRPPLTLYIKNDNSLWGVGNNEGGLLGDDTGVDKEEPIHIMNEVANVYISGNLVFALQTDKSLWTWGGGNFYPVHIVDNVANVIQVGDMIPAGTPLIIHSSTGFVYNMRRRGAWEQTNEDEDEIEVTRLLSVPVLDVAIQRAELGNIAYIDVDHTLIRRNYIFTNFDGEDEIATDVERILFSERGNILFSKRDGTLWGIGQNANGELGDGTRVPRNEPVQIADDVVYARAFAFLKQDGTFWTWNQNDPTPQQVLEGVLKESDNLIYFNDGRVLVDFNAEHEGIRVPRTLVFE